MPHHASQPASFWRLAKVAFVGLGNLTLVGLILLIFVDVVMRNTVNMPIPAVMEVTQHWMMVPMVFIGIWWAGLSNEHVRVTIMTEKLGPKAQLAAEVIGGVMSVLLLLVMSWYAFGVAYDSFESGEYAGAYEIYIWPVRFVTGLGFASLAILIAQRLYTLVRQGGPAAETPADISEAL